MAVREDTGSGKGVCNHDLHKVMSWFANRHGRKIMFRRKNTGGGHKMELCYDGALVLPSSYAVMDEEEMTYSEGGGRRTCKSGWAAAVALTSAGLFLSGMGKAVGVTIIRGCIGRSNCLDMELQQL
ncbi:MAG: hypothetical protein ACLTLY_03975 [Agathobacter rectalis]